MILISFQGPVSLSDVNLEKCPPATTTPTTKPTTQPGKRRDEWMNQKVAPKWQELISSDSTFQVAFDMVDDLINPLHGAFSISKDMKRSVRFRYINLKAANDILNFPTWKTIRFFFLPPRQIPNKHTTRALPRVKAHLCYR